MCPPSPAPTPNPLTIFFSSAPEDEALSKELVKHLSILQRQGHISTWHHRDISAGAEWQHEIDTHLESADIILLLVSPDFLASDYCYDSPKNNTVGLYTSKQVQNLLISSTRNAARSASQAH